MKSTKEKILYSAIKLFNEKGLAHVRLQHIADETGISVGNLAYHYTGMKKIISAIDQELHAQIAPVLSEARNFPGLIDFDAQLSQYYHLIVKYAFYFHDIVEVRRLFPKLYEQREVYIQQIIAQINNWLNQSVEKGLIKAESRPGQYSIVSYTIWIIITFWMSRPIPSYEPGDDERMFKKVVWSQIIPYLTEVGQTEFELIIDNLIEISIFKQL